MLFFFSRSLCCIVEWIIKHHSSCYISNQLYIRIYISSLKFNIYSYQILHFVIIYSPRQHQTIHSQVIHFEWTTFQTYCSRDINKLEPCIEYNFFFFRLDGTEPNVHFDQCNKFLHRDSCVISLCPADRNWLFEKTLLALFQKAKI